MELVGGEGVEVQGDHQDQAHNTEADYSQGREDHIVEYHHELKLRDST